MEPATDRLREAGMSTIVYLLLVLGAAVVAGSLVVSIAIDVGASAGRTARPPDAAAAP